MAKKRPSEQIKKALEPWEGRHLVYERLDYYEAIVKSILKNMGEPTDLADLMQFKKPTKKIKHLRTVLWSAERVRECIQEKDAEGAARFMFKLAVAVQDADMSLIGSLHKGHTKNREWLEMAIRKATKARQTTNCRMLWQYFKVEHQLRLSKDGKENTMELESPVYGSVYFQNENLLFDNKDTIDSITKPTFQKKLTELKKNPS